MLLFLFTPTHKETPPSAQRTEEQQFLLRALKEELKEELAPRKIQVKDVQTGAAVQQELDSIEKMVQVVPSTSGNASPCALKNKTKVESFLKGLGEQMMFRTSIEPCGEIVGRAHRLESIQKVIDFVNESKEDIRINLVQHPQ